MRSSPTPFDWLFIAALVAATLLAVALFTGKARGYEIELTADVAVSDNLNRNLKAAVDEMTAALAGKGCVLFQVEMFANFANLAGKTPVVKVRVKCTKWERTEVAR